MDGKLKYQKIDTEESNENNTQFREIGTVVNQQLNWKKKALFILKLFGALLLLTLIFLFVCFIIVVIWKV